LSISEYEEGVLTELMIGAQVIILARGMYLGAGLIRGFLMAGGFCFSQLISTASMMVGAVVAREKNRLAVDF